MADEGKINIRLVVDQASLSAADQALGGFENRQRQRQQNATSARTQNARAAADEEIKQARRVEQEEQASEQRRRSHRMGISSRETLMDSNMGGRRSVGWDFLGGQSFRSIGFQLRAIPGGGIPETLGRLAPLADVFTEIATGASRAGAGALIFTGALVAFSLAVQALNNQLNTARRNLESAIDAQKKYYEAVASEKTVRDIHEQIRELERLAEAQRARIAELRGATSSVFAQSSSNFGDAGARILDVLGFSPTRQLQEELDKLNKELGTSEQSITRLQQGLAEGAFAADDMAEAEQRLREERIKVFREQLSQIESNALRERDNFNLRFTGTSKQVTEMIAENNQLAATYERLIPGAALTVAAVESQISAQRNHMKSLTVGTEEYGDAAAELDALKEALSVAEDVLGRYTAKHTEYSDQMRDLQEVLGFVIAREQERARLLAVESGLTTQTDMLFEEQTNLGEALERVREATEAYNEALADHQERLAEIDAEAQEKREEAYADAADDFAEAEEEAQKKREEQEKEHRDRIAEINRKADRDIANAIANRDALAAHLAEQQRQDDLADEAKRHKDQLEQIEEAYDDQKKAIQKRLDEQLEDIEKAAAKARATEQKRFAEQARDLQAAIDKQRSMVQLAEARLDQIRTGFMSGRVIKEYDHQNKLYNIAVAAQDAMLFRTQYFWNAMVDTIKVPGALARGGGGGGTVARMGAAIDRRVDMRLNETFRAAERILIQ